MIVATKLDRLARSAHHLLAVAKELEALGVALVVTDQPIDSTTPTGHFLFTTLGAVAELERDLIRDRIVAGIQRAKTQGRHLGRRAGHSIDTAQVTRLLTDGLSLRAVARLASIRSPSPGRSGPVTKGGRQAARKAASLALA